MTSNLIFTVYYSDQQQQQQQNREGQHTQEEFGNADLNRYYEHYFVHVILNERILKLKGLNDPLNPLAPIPLKSFLNFIKSCDFEQFEILCQLSTGAWEAIN